MSVDINNCYLYLLLGQAQILSWKEENKHTQQKGRSTYRMKNRKTMKERIGKKYKREIKEEISVGRNTDEQRKN